MVFSRGALIKDSSSVAYREYYRTSSENSLDLPNSFQSARFPIWITNSCSEGDTWRQADVQHNTVTPSWVVRAIVTWLLQCPTRSPYKISISNCHDQFCPITIAPFGDAYEKIGTIQRRLAWPLHKDDTLFQSGRPTGLNIYFYFLSDGPNLSISPFFVDLHWFTIPTLCGQLYTLSKFPCTWTWMNILRHCRYHFALFHHSPKSLPKTKKGVLGDKSPERVFRPI